MTNSFRNSPRLIKGAILGIDITNPLASIVVFQYNPDTLNRTLQPQMTGENQGRSMDVRFKGPPVETIRLEIEIDATDQLEAADPLAVDNGIHPQLAALEMLIYPKSALAIANTVLLATGVLEVVQPMAPFTLFIWGPKRVLPVRLTDFSIAEEAYDTNLNPIRAKVSLNLRVLSYNDLPLLHPGYALSLTGQIQKEVLASISSVGTLTGTGSVSISQVLGG